MESIDFEILMIAYSYGDQYVEIIDLAQGEKIPDFLISDLCDPAIEKHAHNASFERNAFKTIGIDTPIDQWYCSSVKAAYCGLPLSLENVSKALKLGSESKSKTGKDLISLFSCPVKPTIKNSHRDRNFPSDYPNEWNEFKEYCKQDVIAEKAIYNRLIKYEIPILERKHYILDQEINDRGVKIDLDMAKRCITISDKYTKDCMTFLKEKTNLDNPNSPLQLRSWLESKLQINVPSLAKESVKDLLDFSEDETVSEVLEYRQRISKTSTKKYITMIKCVCSDDRIRGLLQFYGANRTGRWAGRLVQLQNLPRNSMKDLDLAREIVKSGDYDLLCMAYGNVSDTLSQLIRATFIGENNKTLGVSDFSSIEARVIAWLANQDWRMEVFRTHGKIYEASASMMFGVPMDQIKKGSELRDRGKVAELALGYQGSLGALKSMGGEKMGLSDTEMKIIVKKWREKSPKIVELWYDAEHCAVKAVRLKTKVISKFRGLEYECDDYALTIKLPSGRKLFYVDPKLKINQFEKTAVCYKGIDQKTGQWSSVDTYGGKLIENIVQAISRDLLAESMLRLNDKGYQITMHVHDEVVVELDESSSEDKLHEMNQIMSESPEWSKDLPSPCEGYITKFYKKD